jgi:nicotinamidase-related amidase
MWNGYPCCTGRGLYAALVPRMNRALAGMRTLGATVIHAPSDVSDQYVGWPQAERVAALPRSELPAVRSIAEPRFPYAGQTCLCGPGIACPYMHHWHAVHADLVIAEQDYLLVGPVYGSGGTQRLHALCRQRRLTHLLYLGIATNNCVVSKAAGMLFLARAGLEVILARDLTAAYDRYDPATGYTNDHATERAVAALEEQFCATVDLGAELARAGCWPAEPPVDAVHIMPWGQRDQPYLFEEQFTATLTFPTGPARGVPPDTAIHYTLDGSVPSQAAPRYRAPLSIDSTGVLRARPFARGCAVGVESTSHFFRLAPPPPRPQVHLGDLQPLRATSPRLLDGHTYNAVAPDVGFDRASGGGPLRIGGRRHQRGVGTLLPAHLVYAVEPHWRRFVALAGLDDAVLDQDHGMLHASRAAVRFRVFVDGEPAAESPILRAAQVWRFDLPLPEGVAVISLAAMAALPGGLCAAADWVAAGFLSA